MDYPKELLILTGVGVVLTIFLIYYVIRLERTIVKILRQNERRLKKQKEMAQEAEKYWSKKH